MTPSCPVPSTRIITWPTPDQAEITERTVRHDRPVVERRRIRELAAIGVRIESHSGGRRTSSSRSIATIGSGSSSRARSRRSIPCPTTAPRHRGVFLDQRRPGLLRAGHADGPGSVLAIGRRIGVSFADRDDAPDVRAPVIVAGEATFRRRDAGAQRSDRCARSWSERRPSVRRAVPLSSASSPRICASIRVAACHSRRLAGSSQSSFDRGSRCTPCGSCSHRPRLELG